jgi:hypothetical protein
MAFVYIVRCNFTDPGKEQAWNAWYSGPKMAQMLAQPHFRSCQRFRRASGSGRGYLALWTVETPQALATPQYVSQWGFADWVSLVTDWSRDLFDGSAQADDAFAVASQGALDVASFDGMSADEAEVARAAVARVEPAMMWLPAVGLDRHTPVIGLRPLGELSPASNGDGNRAVQRAVYRPMTEYRRARPIAQEAG